jgi:hypothetical protein
LTGPSSSRITHYEYEQLVDRILTVVDGMVPEEATVLVVSKGDEQLLQLGGREAWHFPRDEDGKYAGYYPVDSSAAIAHLEQLRDRGARYIVFPTSALWWFEHYEDFARYLTRRYRTVLRKEDTCVIFELEEGDHEAEGSEERRKSRLYGEQRLATQLEEIVVALLPPQSVPVVVSLGDPELVALDGRESWEFPRAAGARDEVAIERLGQFVESGAEFFVVPRSAFEWLARRPALIEYLERHHRPVTRQENVCLIYELVPPAAGAPDAREKNGAAYEGGRRSWRSLFRLPKQGAGRA